MAGGRMIVSGGVQYTPQDAERFGIVADESTVTGRKNRRVRNKARGAQNMGATTPGPVVAAAGADGAAVLGTTAAHLPDGHGHSTGSSDSDD